MISNFISVPTWENDIWSHTDFATREEFIDFLLPLFKEPGKCDFDETIIQFKSEGLKYEEKGYYCAFPEGSPAASLCKKWIGQIRPISGVLPYVANQQVIF